MGRRNAKAKHVSVLQELPKYLRGYHNCSREETINLAALLLRIRLGNDHSQLAMIPRMLKELVPVDQLKAASENEWKKVGRDLKNPTKHSQLLFMNKGKKKYGDAVYWPRKNIQKNQKMSIILIFSSYCDKTRQTNKQTFNSKINVKIIEKTK